MQAEKVIENALAAVAASRALRDRALARRAENLKRLESAPKPVYILKKYGGRQLSLGLESSAP